MFNQIFVLFKTLNSSQVLFIGSREKQDTIIPVGKFFGTYIRKKQQQAIAMAIIVHAALLQKIEKSKGCKKKQNKNFSRSRLMVKVEVTYRISHC